MAHKGLTGKWETPLGWRISPVGEVVEFHREQVTPASHPTKHFHHFSIPAYDEDNGPVMELGRDIGSNKTTVPPDSVLVSKLNPRIPRVWMPEIGERHHAIASTEFLVLRPTHIDRRFLKHLFLSPLMSSELVARATGTTRSHQRVRAPDVLAIPVGLPPLPEQRKIAAILSSVDDAIEKTQAVIDQVQVAKRGLMQELLTRGLPGRHTRFKQTEIGEIPEEWQLRKLAEVASVQTGLAKNRGNAGSLSVPYLRVANVQDGFLDLAEVKSIEVNEKALTRYALKEGDVLFTEGGDADKLGRGTVWSGEIDPCLHQNHVFVARSLGSLRPKFLSLYGGSSRGKSYFLNCSKQTTNLASMNSTQLKGLPVPLPPLDEQDEILDRIGVFDGRLKLDDDYLDELNSLKSSLLSVLLSGELRVTLAREPA